MTENQSPTPESCKERALTIPKFREPYDVEENRLCICKTGSGGEHRQELCNFVPILEAVYTYDDGADQKTVYRISGVDEHGGASDTDVVMLAPVSVHADHLRQGIGSAMIRLGIEKVKEMGFRGIIVEGNYRFYNTVGFKTSSDYGIFPVSGYPLTEPRCQMCMETYPGSLKDKGGYVVYDMYYNA